MLPMAFPSLSYLLLSQISISLLLASNILPRVSGLCLEDERWLLFRAFPTSSRPQSWSSDTDCCRRWNGVRCDNSTGHVTHLDLSSNKFQSPIPTSLFHLPNLTHLNLSSSAFTDEIPHETSLLKNLVVLDLSGNQLNGTIPSSVFTLPWLRVINMSQNKLTGQIPGSIGKLTHLESLDLSQNKLSGQIPYQMTNITFLSVLNLSYNHLSGRIPQAGQFLTFTNESFAGNSGLCGPPLSVDCRDAQAAAPQHSANENEDSSANGADWKLIRVELGYIVGLAAVFIM